MELPRYTAMLFLAPLRTGANEQNAGSGGRQTGEGREARVSSPWGIAFQESDLCHSVSRSRPAFQSMRAGNRCLGGISIAGFTYVLQSNSPCCRLPFRSCRSPPVIPLGWPNIPLLLIFSPPGRSIIPTSLPTRQTWHAEGCRLHSYRITDSHGAGGDPGVHRNTWIWRPDKSQSRPRRHE